MAIERYAEDLLNEVGKVVRKKGQPYDAHHIIENKFEGPHEWWNMHPAKFPDEHQSAIHGTGSPANELFKWNIEAISKILSHD